MKTIGIFLIGALLALEVSGQKYGTTLGIRLGNAHYRTAGISIEQRVMEHLTFEGIFQSDFNRNTTAHGLVKHHLPVFTKRINLFTGAGISLGNEESIMEDPISREVITTYDHQTIGADFIVGAEVTLLGINASLDYKPNINLIGRENWYQGQVGLSVRTVLINDKDRKKRKRKKARSKRREKQRSDRKR